MTRAKDMQNKGAPMPWWPRDFAADEHVAMMSLEAEGAYRRLLDHQWLHGSIPSDLPALAKLCKGTSLPRMRKLWPEIAPCFVPIGADRLANGRLERVRIEAIQFKERKVNAALASWEQRRSKADAVQEQCNVGATSVHVPPSPTPTPVTTSSSPAWAKLVNALGRDPDREKVIDFLEQVPQGNSDAWALLILDCLTEGMNGRASATGQQVARGAADYLALANGKWVPRLFRACVQSVMDGRAKRPATDRTGEAIAASQAWAKGDAA